MFHIVLLSSHLNESKEKKMKNLPEIPGYSHEDFLSNKKFREFLDSIYGICGAEYDDTVKCFLVTRLCSRLSERDATHEKGCRREKLRTTLFENKCFQGLLGEARKNLGITQDSPKTVYKDVDTAYEDLLFQISVSQGKTKDFDKEVFNYKKASTDESFCKQHPFLVSAMCSINRQVDNILAIYSLDPGWRNFVMASIAAPSKLQDGVPFARVLPTDFPITIEKATPSEITVTIRPGVTKGSFSDLYEACRPILAQPTHAETLDDYLLIVRPLSVDTSSPYHTTIQDLVEITCKDGYSLYEEDRLKKLYRYKRL